MKQGKFSYRIFDTVLNSTIALPELPAASEENTSNLNNLVFRVSDRALCNRQDLERLFQWYLPDGRVSLSCGKILDRYYLHFPRLADFAIAPLENTITCSPACVTDNFTLRHLLLDQVIPRLLDHNGQLILHASAVRLKGQTLLFLGETGQGKSTLAMALQQHGCQLVTDDCVRFFFSGNNVNCIANYVGARLWPDSFNTLNPLCHNVEKNAGSGKTRLYFSFEDDDGPSSFPVKAIFFLKTSPDDLSEECCTLVPVSGANKFIDMNKHCFPLDPTDPASTRSRFQNMTRLGNSDALFFARLCYKRDYTVLSDICQRVLSAGIENFTSGGRQK